jgi:hypothetical protein
MVYSNKFVMCVLINGHVQKELANGVVPIPFGSEYTLRFRNKHNRRAVVQIYIDGENVSGGGYVINANDSVDIRRHSDVDRAFKFVSLDSEEAHEHGKNGPNTDKVKGTIEARFYLEKEEIRVREIHHDHHHHHHHDHWVRPRPPFQPMPWITYGSTSAGPVSNDSYRAKGMSMLRSRSGPSGQSGGTVSPASMNFAASCSMGEAAPLLSDTSDRSREYVSDRSLSGSELKDGATVEGNTTGQSFHTVHVDLEDTYTTLKVFLQGYDETKQVASFQDTPASKRKTVKDKRLDDLESENEELRRKLAEAENEKLKKELERAQEKKAKPSRRKKKSS